jgi:hypothetical protein
LFRQDRNESKGGGVLLLINAQLQPVPLSYTPDTPLEPQQRDFNSIWCSVVFQRSRASIGCVYRSPSSSNQSDVLLVDEISHIASLCHDFRIVMGDFNLPCIDWDLGSSPPAFESFVNCFADNYLTQVVPCPTRAKNILDLVFVNDPTLVLDLDVSDSFPGSDHQSVWFKLNVITHNSRRTSVSTFNFSKADWNMFQSILESVDWDAIFSSSDVNHVWMQFRDKLLESARKSIPLKKKCNFVRGIPCSGEVRRAWRARKKIYKRCRGITSHFADNLRNSADRRLSSALECTRRHFEAKVGSKAKSDPKLFWSMVRGRFACKSVLQCVLRTDTSPTSSDSETAEKMNEYFASVFTNEPSNVLPDLSNICNCTLSDISIDANDVSKILTGLPNNSSPGPDGISYPLLKHGGRKFAEQCARLFNFLIGVSVLPDEWKCANIVPVYKGKGSKVDPKSYRPISLTCVFSKVLERLVKNVVTDYLLSNNLLNSSQHGFLPRRSCLTNLLSFFETLTDVVDQRLCADVAYLDFSRAFDIIPHKRLLLKLHCLGIKGKLHGLISSFLQERKQRVTIRQAQSSWSPVLSGVPQGTVLGPLLFLVYVNDLDGVVFSSKLLKFADDVKVLSIFDPHTVSRLYSPLNDDLYRISKWCEQWCLKLNTEKCTCMHIGVTNPCLPVCMSDNNVTLSTASSLKDLGVWISCDLKPSIQCLKAASKSHRMLSIIKLCFKHLDAPTLVKLYKAFVRPIIDYCSVAWCPYYMKDIDELEKVQRRMSRMLPHLKQMTYEERLAHLRLSSLKLRRLRYDLISVFNILNNCMNLDSNLFFTYQNSVSRESSVSTRGSEGKLHVKYARLELRRSWFSQRVVPFWNALPASCKEAKNSLTFKRELDIFLSSNNISPP